MSTSTQLTRRPRCARNSDTIPLAVEALSALQVIHEQGLIHRDLKPANIFVTPHGVKILDFGLARPASAIVDPALTQTATRLTDGGVMMGTPRYMSPEQIQGQPLDARTDLLQRTRRREADAALAFTQFGGPQLVR